MSNISPYFSASPQLRRSPRKAAAAAMLVTSALLPTSAEASFLAPSSSPSSALRSKHTTAINVTPTPSQQTKSSSSSSSDSPTKKSSPSRRASTPPKSDTESKSPSPNKKQKKTAAEKKSANAPVTESFEPTWSKKFTKPGETPVPVHTLLLGTHPSKKSLEAEQYYGWPRNAFWWIAGDCLHFRRGSAVSESTGKPYKFAADLRYPATPENVLSYDDQLKRLTQHGFALWDVVASCQRHGSLDQDIIQERPNPIREFCEQHPSLKRIVLCNGGTGSTIFVRHFRDWLETGDLVALEGHEASNKAFGKAIAKGEQKRGKSNSSKNNDGKDKIVLISALSVSPAAAGHRYHEKRDFWDEHVYTPGLKDHKAWQKKSAEKEAEEK